MTNLGTAYVSVMPSMKGFGAAVESGMSSIDTSKSGSAMGQKAAGGFAGGLAKGGAIAGAAAAVSARAFDAISSSMGRAVSRVDTMANFPKVMTNLGYSADDAASSIETMSDKLDGLPTSLDGMTAFVQQLAPMSGSLSKATQIGLAFNNMLLAGGASAQEQASAMMQYTQALAKGKPDMQDWRALQQTVPGQLNQIAQAMLGATANSNDLYASLKDGKISMEDFNEAILRLNTEGVNGFASFEQQARDATTGIQTAFDNLNTRMAKGVATLVDSVGQENISGAINYLSSGIGSVAKDLGEGLKDATEFVKQYEDQLKGLVQAAYTVAPSIIKMWGAFKLFQGGKALFGNMGSGIAGMTGKINSLGLQALLLGNNLASAGRVGAGAFQSIGRAMAGLSVGQVAGAVVAAAGLAYAAINIADAFERAKERQEDFNLATQGFSAAVSEIISPSAEAASTIEAVSEKTASAKLDMDAFMESQVQHAQNVITLRDSLNEQVNTLTAARETIAAYAGQTNLSAAQMAAYKNAINDVNNACGTQFRVVEDANNALSAADGSYSTAASAAGEYAAQLDQVIQKKKEEARVNAAAGALEEGYAARDDALKNYTTAVTNYNKTYGEWQDAVARGDEAMASGLQTNVQHAEDAMNRSKDILDARNADIKTLEANLDNAGNAAQNASSALVTLATETGFDQMLSQSGYTVDQFGKAMEDAGVKVETLATLSPQQLATMATQFKGSSDSIVGYLKSIDLVTIGDKSFRVDDNGTIYDGETKLGDLNGFTIGDKHYWVTSDGTVMSEQGEVGSLKNAIGEVPNRQYSINGNAPQSTGEVGVLTNAINSVPRNTTANVTANVSGGDAVEALKGMIDGVKSKTVNIVTNVVKNVFGFGAATGGVSGTPWDLSSAYIPRMATGGIVTKPTLTNNGWVGEAGAEAVMNWGTGGAVIPLTNRRYMLPIAKAIASSMPGQSAPTSITFVVNGASNPEQFARQTMRKVGQIQRAR